jgi:hypothetical protein
MLVLGCICGGVLEIGLLGLLATVVTFLSNWVANKYNRHKCKQAKCQHYCDNRNDYDHRDDPDFRLINNAFVKFKEGKDNDHA